MGKRLQPDLFVKSIFTLDISWLKERGVKGVLLDIDNTLVTHRQKIPDKKVITRLKYFEENNIKTAIVSNASKKRVEKFNTDLNLCAVYRSYKPSLKGFRKAMDTLGLMPNETAVIGDQLFTDIYGGNRLGLTTILVKPLDVHEPVTVKFKRLFEKIFIRQDPV